MLIRFFPTSVFCWFYVDTIRRIKYPTFTRKWFMDVWVIAAAAGAGYVARHFKKLTKGKCNCSDVKSENLEIAPKSLGTVKKVYECLGEETCRQREQECFHDASGVEMASTSGFLGENLVMMDDLGTSGLVSSSCFLSGPSNNKDIQGDWEGRLLSFTDEDISRNNSMPQPSSSEIGFSYGFRRNKSSLRSRRVNCKFLKPRTSLESCLMAQLYKEHAEMEEDTDSVHSLPKPIVRPLVVMDGSRVISRDPHQSCSKQIGTGNYLLPKNNIHLQENSTVFCVPRLPNVVPMELQTRAKAKFGKDPVSTRSNISKIVNKREYNPQEPSSDGALLFYLGLTMGITYSSLRHKLEIQRLRKSLEQTKDLVQDLHEELEMKDASALKETAVEDYESLDVHNDSYFNDAMRALSPEQKLDSDEYCDRNAEEDSLRKIEAELEAELGRLASKMNASRLEGKLSNVAELDPDFISNVIEGDLAADLFGVKSSTTQKAYAVREESGSSTTTTRSFNYPVSPRDLTLRLHKVIQSRLEERIKELETTLEQSQTKIKCMIEFESTKFVDQPVVINLSGEAQSAYNGVFEELTKLSESDEEESKHHQVVVISQPRQRDNDFGLLDSYAISDGSLKTGFSSRQEEDAHINLSNDVLCNSRDESEDELERLLIKQIVEKARQGSPAVLKVQRELLLSSDENYNWLKTI